MNSEEVLGPGGPVSHRLARYEARPEQLQMAKAVENAIRGGRHLAVEAGTGVGKSFAYLVPVILRTAETSDRAVVSTHTISLQEQLLVKDIPFLSGILPAEFSVVLAKGRGNYPCWRRILAAKEEQLSLFSLSSEMEELQRIVSFAEESPDGTLQDLDFFPSREVWSRVSAEVGTCSSRRCDHSDQCAFFRARRRLFNANIVIANHALVMSDLALRQGGSGILPDYDVLVLDEAHEVESVAADHLGLRVTSGAIRHLLAALVGKGGKGLLSAAGANEDEQGAVEEARTAAERLFADVARWAAHTSSRNLRMLEPEAIPETLSEAMARLATVLAHLARDNEGEPLEPELAGRSNQCEAISEGVREFFEQAVEEDVYWVDMDEKARRVELRSAPVRVGGILAESLFSAARSVVLTSATLAIGKDRSFAYLRDRLGLDDAEELALGSPFDYVHKVRIRIPPSMPDPRNGEAFAAAVAREVVSAIRRSDGRAFVLFTSYRFMHDIEERTREQIEDAGYRLLVQGSRSRSRLVDAFRDDVTSVLFGTDSFWQGVDVPGQALSHVVITKLPFEVPDRPLVEARMKDIESRGGNPFMEYSLPRAVLKLRQGFGRLIRTQEDEGAVTILDPRIFTRRYGRIFIESLPECAIDRD